MTRGMYASKTCVLVPEAGTTLNRVSLVGHFCSVCVFAISESCCRESAGLGLGPGARRIWIWRLLLP